MKKPLYLPDFKNDDEEFEFWSKFDIEAYFDPDDFAPVAFPNLKPSKQPVSRHQEQSRRAIAID